MTHEANMSTAGIECKFCRGSIMPPKDGKTYNAEDLHCMQCGRSLAKSQDLMKSEEIKKLVNLR